MSELEMALRKEGLWDAVAQGCAETGLAIGDYLRSVLVDVKINTDLQNSAKESAAGVSEEERRKMFAELLHSYPLDFEKTSAAMRAAGVDPDVSAEEAYWLCRDE